MEIFLAWVIFSFVAAAIASAKNRGAGGYFLISLILSPLVGIILAAAMPALPRKDAQASKANTPCPYCLEPIIAGATKCKHCGSVLPSSDPSKRPCPSCARLADVAEKFCPACGHNMTTTT